MLCFLSDFFFNEFSRMVCVIVNLYKNVLKSPWNLRYLIYDGMVKLWWDRQKRPWENLCLEIQALIKYFIYQRWQESLEFIVHADLENKRAL